MKILIVNYRYFISGGPETYMFNVTSALVNRGHTVIPYSIKYDKNKATQYAKYFADPIGSSEAVYYADHDSSFRTKFRVIKRSIYDKAVEYSIRKCVQETKPDVALVLHYKRKLSPAVLVGLKVENIPIIVRYSDFLAVCPQALLLRKQKPCLVCIEKKSFLPSIRYKCVKQSYMASVLHYLSIMYHRVQGFDKLPSAFIVPSDFTKSIFVKAGFPVNKIHTIPTFAPDDLFNIERKVDYSKPLRLLYAGNLETYKGIGTALETMLLLRNTYGDRIQLVIAGDGSEMESVKQFVSQNDLGSSIQILGFVNRNDLIKLYSTCYLALIPSICYENLPNALVECMASGIPVIGSDHGSIREHIKHNSTGLLANVGDAKSWNETICFAVNNIEETEAFAVNARKYAGSVFKEQKHILKLEYLFNNCK